VACAFAARDQRERLAVKKNQDNASRRNEHLRSDLDQVAFGVFKECLVVTIASPARPVDQGKAVVDETLCHPVDVVTAAHRNRQVCVAEGVLLAVRDIAVVHQFQPRPTIECEEIRAKPGILIVIHLIGLYAEVFLVESSHLL